MTAAVVGISWSALPVSPAGAAPRPADFLAASGGLAPLPPTRLAAVTVGARKRVTVQVAGQGGVPASGVAAVLLNLTASAQTAAGSLVAHPHGSAVPGLAHVSFAAGAGASSLVTVPLGSGAVDVENRSAGSVHVSADVTGYYLTGGSDFGGTFRPVTPARVGPSALNTDGSPTTIRVAGVAGVPQNGAAAVLLNITAGGAPGPLVVYRHGAAEPHALTLITSATPTSTQVAVQVGEDGSVDLLGSTVAVSVHVVGYFRTGAALAPGTFVNRLPRTWSSPDPPGIRQLAPGETAEFGSAFEWAPQFGAILAYSVSVVDPASDGTLSVFALLDPPPDVPTLTFAAGHPASSMVVVRSAERGLYQIRNDSASPVDVITTEVGFYTNGNLGAISGRVTDSTGNPVEGVTVGVAIDPDGAQVGTDLAAMATGRDGTYTVSGLPVDSSHFYGVCFNPDLARGSSSPNGDREVCYDGFVDGTATPVPVRAGELTANIDQRLTPAGADASTEIAGQVTDSEGNPLDGVLVQITSSNPTAVPIKIHTRGGRYFMSNLAPDTYHVCFDSTGATGGVSTTGYVRQCFAGAALSFPGDPVPLASGEQRTDVDAALVTGGAITGHVGGAGAQNQLVEITATTDGGSDGFTHPAADGNYRIDGLLEGPHTVCFEFPAAPAPAGANCVEASVVAGALTENVNGQVPGPGGP